jgi:tetratricopeptide (TPR) repeat protein
MRFFLIFLLIIPTLAIGASDDGWKPKPTETTKTCKKGRVWDPAKKRCVKPKGASLDTETLYGAVRELAYAGRYEDAQSVLRAMLDQDDDRVLTYWGFTHRKMGNSELAHSYYTRAIARNPDNVLARSYMGQGKVEDGKIDEAIALWREIKALGAQGTWAETSLRDAIRTGSTYSY